MNKKSLLSVLFIVCLGVSLHANSDSLQKVSQHSLELIYAQNLWLNSSNPAALSQMNILLPGIISANYLMEDGTYKRVQQGDNLNYYSLNTYSYSKINDINLYGRFNYDKSFENGLDYSNVNDPFRLTPYQMIDTLGNDTYDREFFSAAGGLSKPFGERITLGVALDFNVGLSSQNKDPRPQNKVFNMTLTPGVIYSLRKFEFGLNLVYKYYNEEIETTIIQKNTQYRFFTLHGLGQTTSHSARSFNRLYKRSTKGLDFQFSYKNEKIKSLFGADILYYNETAGDGRKAANASWAYIKDDSRLEGIQFDFYTYTSIIREESLHYFGAKLSVNTMLGLEIIQRLEQVNALDLDDWFTYTEEEKYAASEMKIDIFYEFLKMRGLSQKNYSIKVFGNYHNFSQNYYLPNLDENYENLLMGIACSKTVKLRKANLSIGLGFKYKINLNGTQNLGDDNFIAEKIMRPDFEFLTSNYYAPKVELVLEVPMKKIFDQYFIKTTVDVYQGNNGQSRTIFNFSTGVTF